WPSLSSAFYGYRATQPPMGTRFRLRAGFDISTFSPNAQRILRALKNYGIILADAGYGWNIQAQDGDYDHQAWYDIWTKVLATNMEAVDESSLMVDSHSG